jgi:peptide deformylase
MLTPQEHFRGVFINAKILDTFGDDVYVNEGCLSFPDISGVIKRKDSIYVEWYDEHKTYHKSVFHGIRARILQHEIDHTNGVLMIDRMSYREKIKQFSQLENIRKKKALTIYPIA